MTRLSGQSFLVDTNVLVYALDRSSRQYAQASRLLSACVAGRMAGYIAQQNLLELTRVLTRHYRLPAAQALADVQTIARHRRLSVIAPTPGTLSLFFQLASAQTGGIFDVFDLYLAATMRPSGLSTIVTANVRDFAPIAGIEAIDVASLTV